MNSRDYLIGVLSVTAVILLVGLVLVQVSAPPAYAGGGPGEEAGDYVLATGLFQANEDLLYVVDSVAQRMIVYRFNSRTRKAFSPVDGVDLEALRQSTAVDQSAPRRGRRRPNRP